MPSVLARSTSTRWLSGSAPVLYLAAAKFLFHLLTAGRYGIFRDELYYLACGEHLDWGYVDQPPLIALVAWFAHRIFDHSLVGLRLLSAVAGAATVWLAGRFTREMGGGGFAQALAALAVIAAPLFLIVHHWMTMNAFEPLIWLGCAWCVLRAIKRNQPRYFIWFGMLGGVGMENKYTIAFFIAAIVIGLAVTSARRFLATKEFWLGALIGLAIFLPNLIWLVRHDFPFLELMHNIRQTHRDVVRPPVAFVLDQAQIMNPVLVPLWTAGLIWLFADRSAPLRVFGIAYLTLLVAFIGLRAKNYYLSPIYPLLFAAGAVAFEEVTVTRGKWTRVVYAMIVVASTMIFAPLFCPILSPANAITYQKKLGIEPPKTENQPTGPLPQYFADEFGWEEMARETARVYYALPLEQRARTAIFANNYGEAGAIDFFGPQLGLPKSISNHQSYWLWGPDDCDGSSVIVLGSNGRGDREHFRSVEPVGRVEHPYSRRDEHFDIFLCRDFTGDLRTVWAQIKKFN